VEGVSMAFQFIGSLCTFFGIIGSVSTFLDNGRSNSLMPPGPYRGGDILGHKFWWRNLVIACSATSFLLPVLWAISDWAHSTLEPFSGQQWAVLIPLWSGTLLWLTIAWFLVKSSLDAGRIRHYSLWGQYTWFDEWMPSKEPTEPLGRWLPATDPSHGPEGYYWESLKTRDQVGSEIKAYFYIILACLVLAPFFAFFANGAFGALTWFMAFFALISFILVAKQCALYHHLCVMEHWAKQAGRHT
jgi:hypothetical protein